MSDKNTVSDERLKEIDYPANIATLAEVRSMARELQSLRASIPGGVGVQCCMCGKTGLSTIEGDGGTECQLGDGRWTCSQDCYYTAVDWFSRPSSAPSNPVISVFDLIREALRELDNVTALNDQDANCLGCAENLLRQALTAALSAQEGF